MTNPPPTLTRRALLGAAALLPLAGCAGTETLAPPAAPSTQATPGASSARPTAPASTPAGDHAGPLRELERRYDARLGVYALATDTGATVTHRADERFAFCSTFKALAAAAVLHRNPLSHLDEVVRYTEDDLMKSSVITRRHVASGMTIRQLCDAAVRYSDGTAGNLLLRDLGGPARLNAYVRTLGDRVTRMDRTEPAIVEATPGDPRDTSSPRALGTSYLQIVLGNALLPAKRTIIRGLMERNTTGAQRVKAGVPRGWAVANKTGTGDHGTLNDIAFVWPPRSAPILMAIMSSKASRTAAADEALIADTAKYLAGALT